MPETPTKDKEIKEKEREAKDKAKADEREEKERKAEQPARPEKDIEPTEARAVEKAEPERRKEERKEAPEEDARDRKISILFKRKPVRIILLLLQDRKWYTSLLARESGQSYVHAAKTLASLEDSGLVETELSGKKRVTKLTEKGEKLARAIDEVTKGI